MNDESNNGEQDRTDPNERYREAGRRSGEARRRGAQAKLEAEKRKQEAPPAEDRHGRLVAAFDRELDLAEQTGEIHNLQGFVALARLVVQERPVDGPMPIEDARAQLNAKLDEINEHRARAIADGRAKTCPTCGAITYMNTASASTWRGGSGTASAPGGGRGPGDDGAPGSAQGETYCRSSTRAIGRKGGSPERPGSGDYHRTVLDVVAEAKARGVRRDEWVMRQLRLNSTNTAAKSRA